MAQPDSKGDGAGAEARLSIQKIYVKDVSFEVPHSPEIFNSEWKPDVKLDLNNEASRIGEGLYEVVLRVTATVDVDARTAFLAEVNQAGIFSIAGVDDEQIKLLVGSFCPNVLFPYARETMSDLVTRGGFPQFLLAPVNFDALYAQHVADRGEAQADQENAAS